MESTARRHDIDWIRVIAIGLLLIYHTTIGFQPWGVFIGFIKSNESLESLWIPMSMLNIWRIPLLFVVSGMGVAFAIKRRNFKSLLKERTLRILIPFVFGTLVIVPLHAFLWQDYYSQDLQHPMHPYHLWFLGNIFIYVLVLSPLFFFLKSDRSTKFREGLNKLFSNPLGVLLMIIPFILEAEILRPESFETYAINMHGFWLGLVAFLVGFLFVSSGQNVWETLKKWAWVFIAVAFGLYLIRVVYFEYRVPFYLMAIESNLWIFAVFGLGYKFLNKPSDRLTYWSQAAYPVYILHMIFIYLISYLIFGLGWNPWIEFTVVTLGTFLGCWLTYEFVVKRVSFLRPLFGLKKKPNVEVVLSMV